MHVRFVYNIRAPLPHARTRAWDRLFLHFCLAPSYPLCCCPSRPLCYSPLTHSAAAPQGLTHSATALSPILLQPSHLLCCCPSRPHRPLTPLPPPSPQAWDQGFLHLPALSDARACRALPLDISSAQGRCATVEALCKVQQEVLVLSLGSLQVGRGGGGGRGTVLVLNLGSLQVGRGGGGASWWCSGYAACRWAEGGRDTMLVRFIEEYVDGPS